MIDKILRIAKRLMIAGIVAVMVVTSVAGCAKKEEEEFKFTESTGEEKREDMTNNDNASDDKKDENQGEDETEPDQKDDTQTDTTPTDTKKPADGSDTQKDDEQKPSEDTNTPADDEETKTDEGTNEQEKPDEGTQEDGTEPDDGTDKPVEDTTVKAPEISAVAEMNSEQALTALAEVPFKAVLLDSWQANLEDHDESARYGYFRVDTVTIQIYYDAMDQIVSVTVEVDEEEEDIVTDEE